MPKRSPATTLRKIDYIYKLAEFWDTHDLTDFEDELKEVTELVFVRGRDMKVHLSSQETQAVQKMAKKEGLSPEEIIRTWVLQQLARRNNDRRTSNKPRKSRTHQS